ncbi:MAG: hypothetical protein ACRDOS_07035 [Gaiellaceae bacterium]
MSSRRDPLRGYAVHFTRGNDPVSAAKARTALPSSPSHVEIVKWLSDTDDTGYRASLSILWDCFIRPTTYALGVGQSVRELKDAHRSACFSESTLDDLAQLILTRSLYGVGFRQEFLHSHGGRRVTYLPHGGLEAKKWAHDIRECLRGAVDPTDALWQETPFIDELDPDPAKDTSWEREWRVPGGLSFQPHDVAFVFLPEDLQENARRFFAEHRDSNTGPAYLCRYLDPRWRRGRIEQILREPLSDVPPPNRVRSLPARALLARKRNPPGCPAAIAPCDLRGPSTVPA